MIVIRRDQRDSGGKTAKRSFLPLIGIIVIFALFFILIPIGLTIIFDLQWYLSFIYPFGIIMGAIMIISGIFIVYKGIRELRLKYSISGYDGRNNLVTTGIYAHTRNPMYFGATIMIWGWFFVFPYTFLIISAVLFSILLYITAKTEEKQLSEKYGKKYGAYKRKVPFFIPRPWVRN